MEQIKIDIVPVGVAPVAHASQFDNGRQIRFNLFNQGTPYTLTGAETITMVVNGEEEDITNTSDNYVIWDVAEEDCEEVGVIGCEIRIVLGSMLIGSKNFFLEVEMDPYDGKNIRILSVGPADICTFETTLPEPLQSVIVDIVATGGNGTPDNPIPIVGYTEANITANGDTVTIAFGRTVYGGQLDVTRGKLHVTHGIVDLGTLNWFNQGSYFYPLQEEDMGAKSGTTNWLSNCIKQKPATTAWVNMSPWEGGFGGIQFRVKDDGTSQTALEFKTRVQGFMLAYELATPFDIDLTPVQVRALVGENNVIVDCGQTEVEYMAEV